jgi:hypothetical protein
MMTRQRQSAPTHLQLQRLTLDHLVLQQLLLLALYLVAHIGLYAEHLLEPCDLPRKV